MSVLANQNDFLTFTHTASLDELNNKLNKVKFALTVAKDADTRSELRWMFRQIMKGIVANAAVTPIKPVVVTSAEEQEVSEEDEVWSNR